jgi:ABC-type proline/glycine betaine transport system permease subunit
LAGGVGFNLLEFQGNSSYLILFLLSFVPVGLAYRRDEASRGWQLALVGNLIIILGLLLPEQAGETILLSVEEFLSEDMVINNPRILPSSALVLGLFAGYTVLFAGLQDMRNNDASQFSRMLLGYSGIIIVVFMFSSGTLSEYSFMVELNNRGDLLRQRIIEHITFVSVSLLVGFFVGVGLGLWAARSKQVAPIILYAVGIIQTIPSLALFGLLLSPMASFGDQLFLDILQVLIIGAIVAAAYVVILSFVRSRLPERFHSPLFIVGALIASVPLTLLVALSVSFLYQIVLQRFGAGRTSDELTLQFYNENNIVLAIAGFGFLIWVLRRLSIIREDFKRVANIVIALSFGVAIVLSGVLLVQSADVYMNQQINFDQIEESGQNLLEVLQVTNLGISGIGVAPALVALTLYSLLPLVRNTYAGLNNVDPAIIDSGKGMGMTATQIFFSIELPLALPVIMAGVRNAGVALVGIGTIAQIIGGGGLGAFILRGISSTSIDSILLGLIPAVILALFLDASLRLIEGLLTSPGIRQVEN